jgi:hypothetical protein
MMRWLVLSLVVVLAFGGVAPAAGNPAADALRQQIKALKAQERAAVKAIEAQYDAVIRGDRLGEKELFARRRALDEQEKQALAVATTSEAKDQIRATYGALRKSLSGQIKLDASQIAQLRAQKKAVVSQVAGPYKAKIAELENQLKVVSKSGSSRTPTRSRK